MVWLTKSKFLSLIPYPYPFEYQNTKILLEKIDKVRQ